MKVIDGQTEAGWCTALRENEMGSHGKTGWWQDRLVVRACDSSTQEAETEGAQVQGCPGLHSETLDQKVNKYGNV